MSEELRILVVEDNPADADFIHEMLSEITGSVSFRVETLSRLAQGINRLENKNIDLVLLDLSLPDSHGLQTLHQFRKAAPDIPVVVLTGSDDPELAVAALRDGAQDYLTKGKFDGSLLLRTARYARERQKTETTLRESESRLRAIFDCSRDAIGISVKGKHLFANPAYLKLFGYENTEISAGASILDQIAPSHRQQVLQRIERRAAGEDVPTFYETRGIKADGAEFDMEVSVSTYELQGELHTVATIRDITERKRAEQLLEFVAQEGWAEDFFAGMVEWIARTLGVAHAFIGQIKDAETVRTTGLYVKGKIVADTEYTTRGTPCAKVLGTTLCHYGEQLQELFPDDTLLVEMDAHSYLGIPLKDTSGKPIGLLAVLDTKPMPDAHLGATLLQLAAVRVTGELQRRITLEALRASEALLREAQTIAGLGSYSMDITTGLWRGSDLLDKVFGIDKTYEYSVEGWAKLIHPDDRDMMTSYFSNVVVGQGQPFDREYRILRHNDKAERWVHGLGRLEFDAQGHPVKMIGTIQDVTERKQTEEKIKGQLNELQRWQDVMLGREDRVQELKREVNELCRHAGEALRYSSQTEILAAFKTWESRP